MLNINNIKNYFVRQSTKDDCGTACLAMLLRFSGREGAVSTLQNLPAPTGGHSLLELRNLAAEYGMLAQCAEMDLNFLKSLSTPVILHLVNEAGDHHFVVCFGYVPGRKGGKFIIGDPAFQVYYAAPGEIDEKWGSKAALYFPGLPQGPAKDNQSNLSGMLGLRAYPIGLLVTMPILGLCIATFGVALTWLLQEGLTNTGILKENVIYSAIVLLFIICVFRNLFAFLRQFILIQINLNTNAMLTGQLLAKFSGSGFNSRSTLEENVKAGFVRIQKIQNAVSTFISTVLSDGFLVLLLLGGASYQSCWVGFVNCLFITASAWWEIRLLPGRIYRLNRTTYLSNTAAELLTRNIFSQQFTGENPAETLAFNTFYNDGLRRTKKYAVNLSLKFLLSECLGTLNLIIVIIFSIYRLEYQLIDYGSFLLMVIETYLISAFMQKICASFQVIAEGSEANKAHSNK